MTQMERDRLSALGLPSEALDEQFTLRQVERLAHRKDCSSTPQCTPPTGTVSLRSLCQGVSYHTLRAVQARQAAFVLTVDALPQTIPADPMQVREELRATGELYKVLKSLPGLRGTHWSPVTDATVEHLSERYFALKGELRSPAVRAELVRRCQTVPQAVPQAVASQVVFTIERYRPNETTSELCDALVASFWQSMPVPGYFVMLAPEAVYQYLATHASQWYGDIQQALPVLDTDTLTTWEILAGLWSPAGETRLADLPAALEAARMV